MTSRCGDVIFSLWLWSCVPRGFGAAAGATLVGNWKAGWRSVISVEPKLVTNEVAANVFDPWIYKKHQRETVFCNSLLIKRSSLCFVQLIFPEEKRGVCVCVIQTHTLISQTWIFHSLLLTSSLEMTLILSHITKHHHDNLYSCVPVGLCDPFWGFY